MSKEKSKNTLNDASFSAYGCHLKAKNINKLKIFYRDVIGLGDPLIDSNFWVEFDLPNNGILVLEQSNNVNPKNNKQDVSCLLISDNFELVLKTLKARKITPHRPSVEIPGRSCISITDPENNVITVISGKK